MPPGSTPSRPACTAAPWPPPGSATASAPASRAAVAASSSGVTTRVSSDRVRMPQARRSTSHARAPGGYGRAEWRRDLPSAPANGITTVTTRQLCTLHARSRRYSGGDDRRDAEVPGSRVGRAAGGDAARAMAAGSSAPGCRRPARGRRPGRSEPSSTSARSPPRRELRRRLRQRRPRRLPRARDRGDEHAGRARRGRRRPHARADARVPPARRRSRIGSCASGRWQRGWSRPERLGHDLAGSTLGLVGFGRIGQEVAKRAEAFGMHVVFHRRTGRPAARRAARARPTSSRSTSR